MVSNGWITTREWEAFIGDVIAADTITEGDVIV